MQKGGGRRLIVLGVILLILLIILLIPVGADACWDGEQRWVKLKIGPFKKTLLPGSGKKKPKKKPKAEPPAAQAEEKPKRKLKLAPDDIMELLEIALNVLRRFNYHLSINKLQLHYTAASADPYGAVLQFGRVNALLGALAGPLHTVFHIRNEDVRTELDFEATRPKIAARLVLVIQVWEILFIAVSEGVAGLKWYIKQKREARAEVGSAGKELV
jgi:hypothetical protein